MTLLEDGDATVDKHFKGTFSHSTKLLLIFGSLFFSLIVSELVLRIASRYSVEIRFLATAGSHETKGPYKALEELVAGASNNMVPGRIWFGDRSNSLGFNDREWNRSKNTNTFRIAAVGDSFVYGLVSRAANAQSKIESELTAYCGSTEVMNFGMPATGLWDYKSVIELAGPRYKPDLFVLHFYLGNDGPDAFHKFDDLPREKFGNFKFYLTRFIQNFFLVKFLSKDTPDESSQITTKGQLKASGVIQEGVSHLSFDGYAKVISDELGRLYYTPSTLESWNFRWSRAFEVLLAIKRIVASQGSNLVIVMYPSRVQIEETARKVALDKLKLENNSFSVDAFDVTAPSKELSLFCRENAIDCFDTTSEVLKVQQESPDSLYILNDTHFNLKGNDVIGRIESAFLSSKVCPRMN